MSKLILMLDTNIWLNELTKSKSHEIENLKKWVEENHVELIAPSLIRTEWDRGKERVLSDYEKSLQQNFKSVQGAMRNTVGGSEAIQVKITQLKDVRLKEIEKLLNQAKMINVLNEIKLEAFDLASNKKAPFHNPKKGQNKNSINDAAIFLAGLRYATTTKDSKLIFLSENYKDFTEGKATKEILHPDLISIAVSQEVLFYNNVGELIHKFTGLPVIEPNNVVQSLQSHKKVFQQLNGKLDGLQIVESLEKCIQQIYDELNFIPPFFFAEIYPFAVEAEEATYYNNFNFKTNNPELIELAEKLEVKEGDLIQQEKSGEKVDLDKLTAIFKKLNLNLVYSLSSSGSRRNFISLKHDNTCNCIRCSFQSLRFSESWKVRELQPEDSIQETIKRAFINYRFGDYRTAYLCFIKARTKAKRNKKFILHFICQHNLNKLKDRLEWRLKDNVEDMAVKKELNAINLRKDINQLNFTDYENISLLTWINERWYYTSAVYQTTKHLKEIKKYKESIKNGGGGFTTSIEDLICKYAEFEYFINRNFIILHHYLEFELIHSNFLEGLFTAYTIPEYSSSRLKEFDDYMIQKIIFYCSSDEMAKHISRNKIRRLEYRYDSSNSQFKDWISNLLSDYKEFGEFVNNETVLKRGFAGKYESILSNTLLFMSVINFDRKTEPKFIDMVLRFFRKEKIVQSSVEVIRGFNFYISRKGHLFSKQQLTSLIELVVRSRKFHNRSALATVQRMISNDHSDFKISNTTLTSLVVQMCLVSCHDCNSKHDDDTIGLYFLLASDTEKENISNAVEKQIADNFDSRLYTTAVLYDIINYASCWDQYVEDCLRSLQESGKRMRNDLNLDDAYPVLNDLVNVAFKLNIDLTDAKYDKFRNISDYYDWLLDIEGFDYSKFKPHWLKLIRTKSFWESFKASVSIKKALEVYLRKNKDEYLLKSYFDMYCLN